MMELAVPELDENNEDKSFELKLEKLHNRTYKHTVQIQQNEDRDEKKEDENDITTKKVVCRVLTATYRRLDESNNNNEEKEEEEKKSKDDVENTFYLTFDEGQSGQLLECRWLGDTSDVTVQRTWSSHLGPCEIVRRCGRFLVSSSSDGTTIVRPQNELTRYVMPRFHDRNFKGKIYLDLTHDERFLVSGGPDEQLVVTEIRPQAIVEIAKGNEDSGKNAFLSSQEKPSIRVDRAEQSMDGDDETSSEPVDILDDSVYTIQDDRLKSKQDLREKRANLKKDAKRMKIADLREKLANIIQNNALLDENLRLPDDRFVIDKELFETFVQDGKDLCEEVKKEVEWVRDNVFFS